MHHAPSVSYPVGRGAFQRRLWVVQSLLSLLLVWAWASAQPMGWIGLSVAVALAMATYAQWRMTKPQAWSLHWTQGAWSIQVASPQTDRASVCDGTVKPVFDGQSTLLLRWQSTSDRLGSDVRWLWLDQASHPAHWQDVRRAVYS